MPPVALVVLCAALGGIASATVAVVFLWLPERGAVAMMPHFVSFATGALLGAAFLALLPDAIEGAGAGGAHRVGLTLIVGLGVFFVVEKLALWWHAHDHGGDDHGGHDHARDRASGVLVLVGDCMHNSLDGVLIAAAFLQCRSLGFVTTLAVAAHEIPHRVGDFAILVQAGWSRPRALLLNLGTGLAAVIGAVVAYYFLRRALGALPYALAFAAAGFIYIAVAGLIPGLHRRVDPGAGAVQVVLIGLGVALIALAERLSAV